MKGLHFVSKRRKGGPIYRWYVYVRRGGPLLLIADGPDRPLLAQDDLAEARRLLGEYNPQGNARTIQWLSERWQKSSYWRSLSQGTQNNWRSALRAIESQWGEHPAALFYDPRMRDRVLAWHASRKAKPRAADTGVDVLKHLLSFGASIFRSQVNIAANVPHYYKRNRRPEIIWDDDEIARFIKIAVKNGKKEVAYVLRMAALTGLRLSDLVTLVSGDIKQFAIVKRLKKESRRKRRHASLPTFPMLAGLLKELKAIKRHPGTRTLLVNASGKPWTKSHLSSEFRKIRNLAKIKFIDVDEKNNRIEFEKHLHDVRGTFACKLMRDGDLNDSEVAEVMGWSLRKVENTRRAYVPNRTFAEGLGRRIHRNMGVEAA